MKIYNNIIDFNPETYETKSTMQTDLGTFVSIVKVQKKDRNRPSSFMGADLATLKNYNKYMRRKAAQARLKAENINQIIDKIIDKNEVDLNLCGFQLLENEVKKYKQLYHKYKKEAEVFRNGFIKLVKQRRKELAHMKRVERNMKWKAKLRRNLEKELKEQQKGEM